MKGVITGLIYDFGKKKTIVQVEIEGNVNNQLEQLKGKVLSVIFKIFREKRSLNANAYAWVLINKLAEAMNESDVEIYRQHIKAMGVYRDVDVTAEAENTLKFVWESHGIGWCAERVDYAEKSGYVTLRLYYGSSVYNSKQMNRLISAIVEDCKALGIETKTPQEIEAMIELWNVTERDNRGTSS